MLVETAGTGGSGAGAIRDGIDNSFLLPTPQGDAGNCEVWELILPLVWIGRTMQPDSCGHGRYRSGYSMICTYLIYKTPGLYFDIACGAPYIPMNTGIFGGYPATSHGIAYVKGANIKELIAERKPLVHELGDPRDLDIMKKVKGKHEVFISSPRQFDDVLGDGDVMQGFNNSSAGGYGDPIERDLGLIKKDLDNGVLSLEICRNVYCAEASFDPKTDEYVIDEQKTQELRERERKERLERGTPTKEWWRKSRQRVISGEFPPLLKAMYNDSLAKGERWPEEFRAFWNLPENFTF